MKSLLIPLLLLVSTATAWRFVSKVEELPVDATDRLEIARPKVRLCGGDSEESTDCVLCTVCHPHEYELIGCSGQMDSVCASCTTGWMRSTPKTVDFFRKCKQHPLFLRSISSDYPMSRGVIRIGPAGKFSMFAEQEKMLQEAENTESAETDDLSEETDDYDGEGEDEEEAVEETKDTGVNPVLVDERDEDSASGEVEKSPEDDTEYEYNFHHDMEKMIAMQLDKMRKGSKKDDVVKEKDDVFDSSAEDIDSAERKKEEERADPFDAKTVKKELKVDEDEDNEESEELEHRVYPLHKVNIWRIIGTEKMKIDDKDISDEMRKAIIDRTHKWRMAKGLDKQRIHMSSVEIIDDYSDPRVVSRPLPNKFYDIYGARMTPIEFLGWAFCFSLVAMAMSFNIYLIKRRNRMMMELPELDEMSRQLINEAHARVHSKKCQHWMPKPEFV